jgi:hypothetical protein
MSWIRDLTLLGTKGSKKEQKAKEQLETALKAHGPLYLFTDIFQQITSSPDAQLGFLYLFERYLLKGVLESKSMTEPVLVALVKGCMGLHNRLLRLSSHKKLDLNLKLFNKIVSRLGENEKPIYSKRTVC